MKKLVKLLAALVIVLLVVAGALLPYVDRIAKVAIEKSGTYALGVPTTLQKADVGILSGEFAMSGLNVANPPAFTTAHLLHLDDGGVAVTLGSLRQDVVELPRLGLTGLDVHLERQADGSNYGVVLENLKRLESGDKPAEEPGGSQKKFLVREIRIENVVVHLDLVPAGGELTRLDLPIESIVLKDVGTDSDKGVLLTELAGILLKAVIAAAIDKGGQIIPADMLGDLQGRLAQLESLDAMGVELRAQLESEFQDRLDEITGDLGDLTDPSKSGVDTSKAIEDLKKSADDALGDLLKKSGG
jgi:hypothetical protein